MMPLINKVSVPTYSSRAWMCTTKWAEQVPIQAGVACVGQLGIPACISASPVTAATKGDSVDFKLRTEVQVCRFSSSILGEEKSVFDSASSTSTDVMFLLKGASSRCLQLQDTVSLFSLVSEDGL